MYVRSHIAVKKLTPTYDPAIESMGVQIKTPNGLMDIHNIYYSPSKETTSDTVKFPIENRLNTVICADYNAHHTAWGCKSANKRGEFLYDELQSNAGITIINDTEPTTISGSNIDLVFATPYIASKASVAILKEEVSDVHHPVVTMITLKARLDPGNFKPRYKLDEADWPKYEKVLELAAKEIDLNKYGLEVQAKIIEQLVRKTADQCIPTTKYSEKAYRSWYWNEECANAKKLYNRWARYYKNKQYPRETTGPMLRESRQKYIDCLRKAKADAWNNICDSISLRNNLRESWRRLKYVLGGTLGWTPPRDMNPQETVDKMAMEYASRSKTSNLTNNIIQNLRDGHSRRTRHIEAAISTQDLEIDKSFTMAELNIALKGRKDSSPGEDRVSYSMLAHTGPNFRNLLLNLYNNSWDAKRLPTFWKTATEIPIPKPDNPGATRPISLLSAISKIMERIVLNRMMFKIFHELHPHLFGFNKNKGTTDGICTLMQYASQGRYLGKMHCLAVFADLEKAFELASREVILYELTKMGVCGNMLGWLRDYLTDRKARVLYQGHHSFIHELENGTPQGAVLSPFLFNVIVNKVLKYSYPKGITVVSYADDIAIIANPWMHQAQGVKMQEALRVFEGACEDLGLKINVNKTKAMVFCKTSKSQPPLVLQEQPLEYVNEYKYLGVIFTPKLQFSSYVKRIAAKVRKRTNQLKYILGAEWGISTETALRFFKACIRPLLEYGIQIMPAMDPAAREKIEKIERTALRLALGINNCASSKLIFAEADLIPIKCRAGAATINYATKVVSRAAPHPIVGSLKSTATIHNPVKQLRWHVQVRQLFKEAHLEMPADQPIVPVEPWDNPTDIPNFHIFQLDRPKSKMTNAELEQAGRRYQRDVVDPLINKNNIINLFTDGSVDPSRERAAIGVVLLIKESPAKTLNLRITDGVGTLITELAAIKIALTCCQRFTCTHKEIHLHTDSLSSVYTLQAMPPLDNVLLIQGIYNIIKQLAADGCSVNFHWLPSHAGIQYNELADTEANTGLERTTIDIATQPSLSSIKLLTKKHSKTKYYEEIKSAEDPWVRSYLGPNQNITNKRFQCDLATRRQTSIYLNLATQAYNKCPWHCPTLCDLCGGDLPFTTEHYMTECPVTAKLFADYLDRMPTEDLDRGNTHRTRLMLKYIKDNSEKFRDAVDRRPPQIRCLANHNFRRSFPITKRL
jgi:ribonuclease HI